VFDDRVTPPTRLRPFRETDAVALTALLHRAYAELGAAGLNYTAVDQDVRTTRERAAAGRCWVAEQDDRLVGTMTVSLPPSAELRALAPVADRPGTAWLNQLAVSPTIRGQGIARDLWRHGRRWAHAGGVTTIGLDTAAPATHLVRLYGSWGFAHAGTIRWPGKTYESVVMTRSLTGDDA
jgi:GNAT superfamily N-acetyltransferase